MSRDYCETCKEMVYLEPNGDCPYCVATPEASPLEPHDRAYRDHLRSVTNELHRKLTGCKTGSSSYKITWGKWLQAQDDLLAYERLAGDESSEGGSLPS